MNFPAAMAPLSSPLQAALKDRALQIAVLVLAALALGDAQQLAASGRFVAAAALELAPFLLVSAAAAAWVQAAGADRLIAGAFRGHPLRMVAMGALVGALSPFCSCGVIPIVAALLAIGVPLAPVMAFWISSPLMDPAMFVLTAGTLGAPFAIAKTAAAIGIAFAAGLGAMALVRAGWIGEALRGELAKPDAKARMRTQDAPAWRFWSDAASRAAFRTSFTSKTLFLAKWMGVAFLLESLMVAYVPNELVARVAGGDGFGPVLAAALVGVPAYLNGYAALPLAAGLLEQGMSNGAAMAFLLAGGATSIPAALAVWAIARPRVFAAYLGFAFAGAVAAGWLYGLAGA
jgi:uncharacterized membrane protein YraQ (UPF0718 family)